MTGRLAAAWLGGAVLATAVPAIAPATRAAAATTTAVGPVPPGSQVLFVVHESDVRKVPAPGVVVNVTVSPPSTGGAAVAPAQRSGAVTGAMGATASSPTDNLGNAYFQLGADRTSGTDSFAWSDGHGHAGQVTVQVSTSATPAATSVVASADASAAGPGSTAGASTTLAPVAAATAATASSAPPWRPIVTALAAAALATLLLFVVPRALRRVTSRRRSPGTTDGG